MGLTALMAKADPLPVTLDDIRAAAERIRGAVVRTPTLHSRTLSDVTGAIVYLKFENLQFTAAYKERGALNKLLLMDETRRNRGVIAASAGNHAQAVAYHGRRLGVPVTIVMPKPTPIIKVMQTEGHGATVVLHGELFDEAYAKAKELEAEQNLTFVHPFDDAQTVAGQATVALEMLEDAPDLDALLVPIGGGGLIAGMGIAAKALRPEIEVIGAQAELYPSMYCHLTGEERPSSGDTIAEGIAVKRPGAVTSAIIRQVVDEILLVPERDIETAVSLFLQIEKTVAEGAGAAALGRPLTTERLRGRKVGLSSPAAISTPPCSPPCCCAISPAPAGWRGCASSSRTGRARCSRSCGCSRSTRSTINRSLSQRIFNAPAGQGPVHDFDCEARERRIQRSWMI
jgi:threonine dehydratase